MQKKNLKAKMKSRYQIVNKISNPCTQTNDQPRFVFISIIEIQFKTTNFVRWP